MYIAGKNKIIILNNTTDIYSREKRVCAQFTNGSGTCIEQYDTEREADIALEILKERMGRYQNLIIMPDENEVKAFLERQKDIHRNIAGRKTKGHGGS